MGEHVTAVQAASAPVSVLRPVPSTNMPVLSRLRALAVQTHSWSDGSVEVCLNHSCVGGAVGSTALVPVSAAGGSDGDHEHADWAVPSMPMSGNQGISLAACGCVRPAIHAAPAPLARARRWPRAATSWSYWWLVPHTDSACCVQTSRSFSSILRDGSASRPSSRPRRSPSTRPRSSSTSRTAAVASESGSMTDSRTATRGSCRN